MSTKSKSAPTCGACKYCVPFPPAEDGTPADAGSCRRSPPIPMMKIDGATVSAFPSVRLADVWCGEFQPRGKK